MVLILMWQEKQIWIFWLTGIWRLRIILPPRLTQIIVTHMIIFVVMVSEKEKLRNFDIRMY